MNKAQAIQAISQITFGIEIECMFPAELANQLRIRTSSSNWSDPINMAHVQNEDGISFSDWGASWDQTITRRQDYAPIEFNSGVLKGEEGWASVKRFFKWLADSGAKVDSSCGLHIHLGVKEMVKGQDIDQSIDTILKTMKFANAVKTAIFAQGGSARRYFEGTWARARTSNLRETAESNAKNGNIPCFGGKYFFVNTRNIAQSGLNGRKATIEFRAFAGTTNYAKVLTHLATCLTIAYTGMVIKRSSWESKNQTADKAIASFNNLTSYMSNASFLTQFPTFQAEKRKMWKIGRKMATKFQNNVARYTRGGRLTLEAYK